MLQSLENNAAETPMQLLRGAQAYLRSVGQATPQASGGAAPLTTPAAPVVDDRQPSGNGAMVGPALPSVLPAL